MPIRGLGRPQAYKLADGTRVPSVTTITGARKSGVEGLLAWANKLGMEGKSHREARDAAAGAGTLAHLLVENHIHGLDPLSSINVDETDKEMLAKAYTGFQGYLEWQKVMDVAYLVTEEPMVNEEHRYGGTPDAIGTLKDGRVALCDWKSSNAVYGDYIIQLAAYQYLWNDNVFNKSRQIDAVYLLRFGKEHGDFHLHSYPESVMALGWRAFLLLREMYDLDKQLGKAAT